MVFVLAVNGFGGWIKTGLQLHGSQYRSTSRFPVAWKWISLRSIAESRSSMIIVKCRLTRGPPPYRDSCTWLPYAGTLVPVSISRYWTAPSPVFSAAVFPLLDPTDSVFPQQAFRAFLAGTRCPREADLGDADQRATHLGNNEATMVGCQIRAQTTLRKAYSVPLSPFRPNKSVARRSISDMSSGHDEAHTRPVGGRRPSLKQRKKCRTASRAYLF